MTFLVFLTSAWRRYDPTEGLIYWGTVPIDLFIIAVIANIK